MAETSRVPESGFVSATEQAAVRAALVETLAEPARRAAQRAVHYTTMTGQSAPSSVVRSAEAYTLFEGLGGDLPDGPSVDQVAAACLRDPIGELDLSIHPIPPDPTE